MNILYFIPRFVSGGAEAFIVNVCEMMVARGIKCSIVSIDSKASVYDAKLKRLNIEHITLVEDQGLNIFSLYARGLVEFKKFLRERGGIYDVVHFNIAQGEELPFIRMAKRSGVPIRIMHSHNSGVNSAVKLFGHYICKFLFRNVASSYMACSDKAAEWLVPKRAFNTGNYSIVRNGISTKRFTFNYDSRLAIRNELGLGDDPCILIVGRLDNQKNHSFLIDVLGKLRMQNQCIKLMCVGDGPLKGALETKSRDFGLDGNVLWLGVREDVEALYCAADCFVLPSLFEGFPFCLVEAQASGLPCVVADTVSLQCALTDLVSFHPLNVDDFAHAVSNVLAAKQCERSDYAIRVRDAGYDIESTVESFLNQYEDDER